jgi:hypothetical protein
MLKTILNVLVAIASISSLFAQSAIDAGTINGNPFKLARISAKNAEIFVRLKQGLKAEDRVSQQAIRNFQDQDTCDKLRRRSS